MSIYYNAEKVSRRSMTLFFVIDTSGSMSGKKIGTVNTAIQEVIPKIKDISEDNADAEIKIAVLSFSTGAEWITQAPVAVDDFRWNDIDAGGVTDLGRACNALNEKLSTEAFMKDKKGSYAPAILLMSDGEPTDSYRQSLEELKKNRWFECAIKVAIAIGDDANKEVLADFTGNSESVITTHTPAELAKWIKFLSIKASEIGSRSTNSGNKGKQGELEETIEEEGVWGGGVWNDPLGGYDTDVIF